MTGLPEQGEGVHRRVFFLEGGIVQRLANRRQRVCVDRVILRRRLGMPAPSQRRFSGALSGKDASTKTAGILLLPSSQAPGAFPGCHPFRDLFTPWGGGLPGGAHPSTFETPQWGGSGGP